ncbi:MAG: hypothetical protein K9M07_00985 [Simkaniaceae bacterium]|nr:hypothetical protein [Simkaniaceae bacterium]
MKKLILLSGLGATLLFSGCSTNAGTGALVGAGLGIGAGALIDGGTGAIIGGAIGAAAGGLIGASIDQQQRERLERDNPQTLRRIDNEQQLSVDDVIAMTQAGVESNTIIELIKQSNSKFYLTSPQVIKLKNAGVSNKVIDYMIST